MRILTDFHHEEAYRSTQYLGERLGAKVYRPRGMEWQGSGYWNQVKPRPDVGVLIARHINRYYPGLTLEEVLDDPPDMFIASHPLNKKGYMKLAEEAGKPFVMRAGNNWNLGLPEWGGIKNLLSCPDRRWPDIPNQVTYHPEFRNSRLRLGDKTVKSMVSAQARHEQPALDLFEAIAGKLPDWGAECYGRGRARFTGIRTAINRAGFLLHHKLHGDGYGFVLHRGLASGCPVILPYDTYKNCKAGTKIVDGVTTFDSERPVDEIVKWMLKVAEDYPSHSSKVRKIWEEQCCPDREFKDKLKPFFEKVLNS